MRKKTLFFLLIPAFLMLLSACGVTAPPAPEQTTEPAAPEPVNLSIYWHGNQVMPGGGFGDIISQGDDNVIVDVDGQQVTDFTVRSAEPDIMSVEKTEEGRICLTKLRSFEGRMIEFTITYKGVDYAYKCNDDGLDADGEGSANLFLIWHENEVYPGQCFGSIPDGGDDNVAVFADGQCVMDFEVESGQPDTMSAEKTEAGRIRLTRLKSFEGARIDFTISYGGSFYTFYCDDGTVSAGGGNSGDQPDAFITHPEEYEKFTQRMYSDEELQALVDENLSFNDACDKLSTVSDVVQYLYLRGYRFMPENLGTSAEYRYYSNSGACVGGSALLNALLEGDYDDQGYVYIYYARSEHVLDYFVLDGVYFYCDLVNVFNSGKTDITNNPVCYMTDRPETFLEKWYELEPHDLNDSESDMYLAAMFTTGYFGDTAKSTVMLKNSADGKYASIPLSPDEKASQSILFLRDGYTFEF